MTEQVCCKSNAPLQVLLAYPLLTVICPQLAPSGPLRFQSATHSFQSDRGLLSAYALMLAAASRLWERWAHAAVHLRHQSATPPVPPGLQLVLALSLELWLCCTVNALRAALWCKVG
jgi:hypothetical protein